MGKEAIENFDFTYHQAVLATILKIYAAFNNLSSQIAEDHSKFQLWIDQFSTYFKEDKNFELPKGGGVKTIHAISEIPIECSLSKCADFIRYLRQCNLPTDIFQPVLARLKAIKSRLIADRLIYEKSAYPQKSDIQSFNILISKINELTYDLEIYINYTYSDQYKNYSQKQNLNVLKCVGKVLVYENKSGTRELIGTSTGSVIYLDSNKTQQVIVTTAHFPVNFKKSASAALEIYFIPHTELNTSDFTFNTSYPFDFNAIQKYKAKKIHLPKGEFQFDDATKKTGPCTIGEDKIALIQLIQESNEQDYMFFEVENQFNILCTQLFIDSVCASTATELVSPLTKKHLRLSLQDAESKNNQSTQAAHPAVNTDASDKIDLSGFDYQGFAEGIKKMNAMVFEKQHLHDELKLLGGIFEDRLTHYLTDKVMEVVRARIQPGNKRPFVVNRLGHVQFSDGQY